LIIPSSSSSSTAVGFPPGDSTSYIVHTAQFYIREERVGFVVGDGLLGL
jgi:hypothetical protein